MDDEFVLNIDDGGADEPPPAPTRVSKGTTRNGAASAASAASASSSSSKAHHEQPAPTRTLTRPAKAVAAATKETVSPSPLPPPPRSSRPAAPLPAAAPARDRDRDRARAPDAPLQPAPVPASAPAARRRRLLPEEDPMQFHARPKELSRNALKRARGDDNDEGSGGDPVPSSAAAPVAKVKRPLPAVTTSHIFTRIAFSDLPLDPRLAAHLQKSAADGGMGLPTSTRVQSVVVPLLTTPQNVLMKSQTGSGKTLAYLLPVINDLMTRSPAVQRHDGTRALLLAPTRELCSQIADVLAKLTQCCVSVVGGSVTGGEKKKSEKARLRKGLVVLVATPGRLLDHLRTTESFTLTRLRWVVLDEVDRLLDMGFEQTILEILSIIRGARLPGLKDSKDIGGGGGGGGGSLQQRYSQQNAQRAKQCRSGDELYHLMASATLTQAVRQLAVPVMGGSGESGGVGAGRFVVVDADREAVDYVESAQDLERIAKAKTKVKSDAESAVAAADDGTANNKRSAADDATAAEEDGGRGAKMRRTLEKGEAMDAPQQLAQYYMMVTCKWRLAALLCFLKTHSHQKVMVFFSTCDSVDFHALLFRGTEWPEGLDALPDDAASSGSGGDKSGGNSSKSGGGNGESNNTTFSVEGFEGMQFRGNSDGVVGKTKPSAVKAAAAAAPGARPRLTNRSMGPNSVEPLPPRFTGMFGAACPMYRLHGNVPQHARQTVYKDFCEAKSGVLLCTDVAARGLDLPEVDWILQYDPPCETTDVSCRCFIVLVLCTERLFPLAPLCSTSTAWGARRGVDAWAPRCCFSCPARRRTCSCCIRTTCRRSLSRCSHSSSTRRSTCRVRKNSATWTR